ncbi:MAG: hypothetical protein ACK4UN_18865, partial [Limisphaerales bacterium]
MNVLPDHVDDAAFSVAAAKGVLAGRLPKLGSARPRTSGRFLVVNGQRFWVKGVTYGTFRPNEKGEPYPSPQKVKEDFERMREIGVNTIRLYTPPADWLADLAADSGLRIMADICWGPRRCDDFDNPERLR